MKILIVEDDAPKREAICHLLSTNFNNSELSFAASLNSASRAVEDNEYTCIILDMSLPNFDVDKDITGGRPINYGGEDIIDLIHNLEKTTKVIFISQYARFKESGDEKGIIELAKELEKNYPNYYTTMIYYHSAYDSWKGQLINALKKVQNESN